MDEFDPLAREGRVKALSLDIKKAATALTKPSTTTSAVPSNVASGEEEEASDHIIINNKAPFDDDDEDNYTNNNRKQQHQTMPTRQQQQQQQHGAISFTEHDWGTLGHEYGELKAKKPTATQRLAGFSSTRGRPIGEADFLGIDSSVSRQDDGEDGALEGMKNRDHHGAAAEKHYSHTVEADAGECRVPALEDEDEELEVHRKKTIYVLYKNEETPISWFEEMSLEDVKDALLCACDAMMDSDFVLKQILRRLSDAEWESHSRCRTVNLLDEEIIEEGCVVGSTYHFSQFGDLVDGQLYLLSIPLYQSTKQASPKKEKKKNVEKTSSSSSSSNSDDISNSNDDDDKATSPEEIQRQRIKDIIGDRWRRIRIPVDPTLHVETQKAIITMKRGTNLLKHTRYGYPHLRQFQLSNDEKRLVWYSGAKSKANSMVLIKDIDAIVLGQTTPAFIQYKLPALQHLSFSLTLRDASTGGSSSNPTSLDLTCKDMYEFDSWVTGLKGLMFYNKSRSISKEQLLSHSKRFRKALTKHDASIKLTALPEIKVKGQVTLEQCIEMPSSTIEQLEKKLDRLSHRMKESESQVQDVELSSASDIRNNSSQFDFSALATSSAPSFELLYDDTCGADDEEMEIKRMKDLSVEVASALQIARNDLQYLKSKPKQTSSGATTPGKTKNPRLTPASSSSSKSSAPLSDTSSPSPPSITRKSLDEALWKIEVDVENIEDMLSRRRIGSSASASALYQSLTEWNANMSTSFTQLQDEVTNTLTGWFQSASNAASPHSRQNLSNRLF